MVTITVGPAQADIISSEGSGIQRAIDKLSTHGGGVVEVQSGVYQLRDTLRLKPGITLRGTPGETILQRAPLAVSKLVCDADRGQCVIYPHDPSRFAVGMGIGLFDRASLWTKTSTPYCVTAVHSDCIEIDRHLQEERFEQNDGAVVNYFPMIQAYQADECAIEGFVCDGTSRFEHELTYTIEREIAQAFHEPPPYPFERITAPRTSLVFSETSRNLRVHQVRAHHGAGDGFCFSMASKGLVMRDCEADHNGWYGVHPGSHSARVDISHCHIHHNACDGLYVCWGIHHSTFTHNDIHDNGYVLWRSGFCIGHKDTDNLIAHNRIVGNAKYGICIRDKTPQNAPHRCRYSNNVLENNCTPGDVLTAAKNYAPAHDNILTQVYVGANVRDQEFCGNVFRETRPEMQGRTQAFHIEPSAEGITIADNTLDNVTELAAAVRT